ncbi:MAG: multifunctional fatty acid oxidation complex subunit alpha [Crocinitomicaceae bacterium]|nr:multifunctional fatty acid oxidation complex subunit alpha [Crocinitomicaceae bacterium]
MENDFFRIVKENGIATIWLDFKKEKMNIVSPLLVDEFENIFDTINNDNSINGAVLISAKPDFIAGADIKAFNAEKVGDFQPISKKGHDLLFMIEKSKKPIVSAISGTCYGLGVEMSLACHGRICSDDPKTKLALPEVKLGLLPGGGGTQRLPKLVGVQNALDMMLTGKNIFPKKAKKIGLVDDVVNKNKLHAAATKLVKKLINNQYNRKIKKSTLNKFLDNTSIGRSVVFKAAKKKVNKLTQGNYPAPVEIINCVEIGIKKGSIEGYKAEVIKFEELMLSDVSKALRGIFFNMTDKKKNPYKEQPIKIDRIGVLGAGFMGAGIADISINNKIDVILKDLDEKIISNAKTTIWKTLNRKVKRKQIPIVDAKSTIQRTIGQTNYSGFNKLPIVIEAIVENMEVKKKVIQELEDNCKEDFIFASNTSSLPLTEMAKAAKHPENVVGMHYFSPVPKMPLLEIIKTNQTSEKTLSTCYELGVRQGKTCIVVNDSPGFYVNRILAPYLNEVLLMIEEGAKITTIDKSIKKLGMPVGPVALMDEVGIDIGAHVMGGEMLDLVAQREGVKVSKALPKMFQAGYLGKKNKKGFYNYDNKKGKKTGENPKAYTFFGSPKPIDFSSELINERAILLLLNEAVMCLEEGIIENAKDGDIGGVFGIGFLPWSGGPFSYMNQYGIDNIVERMEKQMANYGPKFSPRPLLTKMKEKESLFKV